MIDDMETIIFKVISASGTAKGLAYEALDKGECGEFQKANVLLCEANKYIDEAHKIQRDLIIDEVNGNAVEISTLLIHAQDHFMIALEVINLVERMLKLYEIIYKVIDERNNKLHV